MSFHSNHPHGFDGGNAAWSTPPRHSVPQDAPPNHERDLAFVEFIITPTKDNPSTEARMMCHEFSKVPSGIVFTIPGREPQDVEFWTDAVNVPAYSY